MHVSRPSVALAALFAALIGLAPPARAGEAEAERLDRLEALVESLRAEIDALRGAQPTQPTQPAQRAQPAQPAQPAQLAPPRPATPPFVPVVAAPPAAAVAPWPSRRDFERTAAEVVGPGALQDALFGGAPSGVRWGGYLQLEYVASSWRNSFVDLHRLILQMDASIGDRIDLTGEIEIEHGGPNDELQGELVLEQLVAAFRVSDAFVPKAGVLLAPFGRYNLFHDDPLNDFTQRPLTARYLVPTGFGQPGLGAEGVLPFGCGHTLAYDFAVTNGFRDDFSAGSGVRDARQRWNQDNNEDKQLWGRLNATLATRFLDRLELGVSGTWARYDDAGRRDLWGTGVDFLVRKGPFEARGEYLRYDLDRDPAAPATAPRGLWGLWLEAGWHFFPRGLCRLGPPFVTDTSHFTLAARYQQTNLNDRLRGGHVNDDVRAWSVGLNYRITERTVFRIDHTWFEIEGFPDRREFTASLSTYF